MKKKIIGIVVCILLIATTGITVAGTFKQSEKITTGSSQGNENTLGWGWYNPVGSWMRSDTYLVMTVGNAGLGKYSIDYEYIHDPTWAYFGNLFPDAVGVTDGRGDFIVKSKNVYEGTLFAIGYDANYQIVYYSVYSGIYEFTSKDTSVGNFTLAFYGPDQDPFCEEEDPLYCFGPFERTYDRIPVVPPC